MAHDGKAREKREREGKDSLYEPPKENQLI
jgi:hypothetical protein